MARVYRLEASAFPSLKRRAMPLISLLAAGALGITIAGVTGAGTLKGLALSIPLVLLALGYGVYSTMKRERLAWQSFELLVSDDAIVRRMQGRPEIEIHRDEVTGFVALRSGALVVKGKDPHHAIIVPQGLEGYDEVLGTLSSWKEPQIAQSGLPPQIRSALLSAAGLALIGTAFLSHNPWIAAPAGVATFGLMVWAAWYIRKSPHYAEDVKRSAWLALLPGLAALVRAVLVVKG